MAYDGNYLYIIHSAGRFGYTLWGYDTTDSAATVDTAGYISDGYTRRMQKGDTVMRTTWSALPTASSDLKTAAGTSPTITTRGSHIVLGVDPTTGAADLTDATAGTMTNTD